MSMRKLEPILPDAQIWTQIQKMRSQNRMAQALLVSIPPSIQFDPFLDYLLSSMVCLEEKAPCGDCQRCRKILMDLHPDVYRVQPENAGTIIKIEQIRELQAIAYQTPQFNSQQLWVIHPAEAMNQAAASALLKILEEPSVSTQFILITNNPSMLLPTIISRCQQIHVREEPPSGDPILLGKQYAESSPRGRIYAQRAEIFADLEALFSKKLCPSDLATQWSEHSTQDLLWFLTTILSKLIQINLVPITCVEQDYQAYSFFAHKWRPEYLYDQLDNIYAILKQLQNHINLNTTLVWERTFLDLLEGYSAC